MTARVSRFNRDTDAHKYLDVDLMPYPNSPSWGRPGHKGYESSFGTRCDKSRIDPARQWWSGRRYGKGEVQKLHTIQKTTAPYP